MTKLRIDNYAYLDTIEGGIQEFFDGYDIRFFGTDTHTPFINDLLIFI